MHFLKHNLITKGQTQMTLINKTIYPQYDKPISKAHLEEYFPPTIEEVKLATTHARGNK